MTHSKKSMGIAFLSSIGSGLEYYCFVSYIMLTPFLSKNFFSHTSSSFVALLVFAVGYLIAPFSALGAGALADRFGRKKIFLGSLLLMSGSTFLMGCLPTYQQIGSLAIFLLMGLRILQGLAQGAEIPGAITFVTEHAEKNNRGFLCGIVFLGVSLGATLSSFINYLLSHLLSLSHMESFGWRLSFLLGGLLGVVGVILRRKTTETPLFLASSNQSFSLQQSFSIAFFKRVFWGMSFVWFAASLVTFGLFFPSFLPEAYGYTTNSIYLPITIAFLIAGILLPLFGYLSDRWNRKYFMMSGVLAGLFFLIPIFHLLSKHSTFALYAGIIAYYVIIVWMASNYLCMLAEHFSTENRYTGVGLAYMGCYSLAGLVPLLTHSLISHFHSPLAIFYYFIPAGIFTLIGTLRFQDKTHLPLT